MANDIKIGVVGYCSPTRFDEVEASRMLRDAYDQIDSQYPNRSKAVVSGLTNIGVLRLAYEEATSRGWRTVGIACNRALEHSLFPVDEKIIVGENWGDESPTFLDSIDMIVRVGGGKQSLRETAETRLRGKPVFEYYLEALK